MFDSLLIDTVTISSKSQTNDGGDVSDSFSALYSGIKGRIYELSSSDKRFIEGKEQYSDVEKKCFLEADKTGISDGDRLVCDSKTYQIEHIREQKDSTGIHHFELFLSIIQ